MITLLSQKWDQSLLFMITAAACSLGNQNLPSSYKFHSYLGDPPESEEQSRIRSEFNAKTFLSKIPPKNASI